MIVHYYGFEGTGVQVARLPRFVSSPFDVKIAPGTAWELQGPNGGGKTTFLKTLLGLIPLFKGTFYSHGHPLDLEDPDHRRQLSYVGHGEGLSPSRFVEAELKQGIRLAQASFCPKTFQEKVDLFHLRPLLKTPCAYLSKGQRQRVILCRVALSNRACWLLDEPLHPLDPNGKAAFERALAQHLAQGGSAILSTPHTSQTMLSLTPLSLYPNRH